MPTPTVPYASLLSTDLSLDRDADDWFDAVVFLTLPRLKPSGVVLEHYATDAVEAKLRELLHILRLENIAVARGIQGRLQRNGVKVTAPQYTSGAALIVGTLRAAESAGGKVRLFCVGSLRNEALAYTQDPGLFCRHVEAVYFAGGNLDGQRECNIDRDELAAEIIFQAPVPKVWVPCSPTHKQKLTAQSEASLRDMQHPLTDFLTGMLARWREGRGAAWLGRTEQLSHQGKNLWSMPLFVRVMPGAPSWVRWQRGRASFQMRQGMAFLADPYGPDVMATSVEGAAVALWAMEHIRQQVRALPG